MSSVPTGGARLPAGVTVSLGLHAAALVAAAFLLKEAPHQAARIVEGVDLLVASKRPAPDSAVPAVKPPPLSTMDFLKLALPTAQHAAPVDLDAAHVVPRRIALAEPKLEDASPWDRAPKLESLDLSRHPTGAATLDAQVDTRRHAAATLAALAPLEDVGRRRVKNLPEALALEDDRRAASALAGVPALDAPAPTRREALAAAAALRDAEPPPGRGGGSPRRGLDSLLPDRPLLDASPRGSSARLAAVAEDPAPVRRAPVAPVAEGGTAKKGVQIEGPLKNRRIASYTVPAFPDWAKDQGILGADVSIRFTVDESGAVLPGMSVVATSGYGRIDKLALDALKAWRFSEKPGVGVQWGVITFHFVLD